MTQQLSEEIFEAARYPWHELRLPAGASAPHLFALAERYRFMLHALRKWLLFQEDITGGAAANAAD